MDGWIGSFGAKGGEDGDRPPEKKRKQKRKGKKKEALSSPVRSATVRSGSGSVSLKPLGGEGTICR